MAAPDTISARVAGVLASLDVEGQRRLLVVDDEESIRISMSKFLRSRGYDVHTAENGIQALELLKVKHFDALLCDVRMPGMAGTDVVPRAIELSPDLSILMLTAVNDAPTVTEVLARGAMDYLMKPVDFADLALAVDRAVRRRDLRIRQRHVERLVLDEVARTDTMRRDRQALEQGAVAVVRLLVEAHEGKDDFLKGHSKRVADVAAAVGKGMGFADAEIARLRLAGELHDVGNVGVPDMVRCKPGPLSPDERLRIQDHVRLGVGILSSMASLSAVLPAIRDHHERWDGGGYPGQLAGERISLGGRVLAAADAFVASTSPRAYRAAATKDVAVARLALDAGSQLDPEVFKALQRVVTV